MLIIDAHLDLAMNALRLQRDLTLPVAVTRRLEQGMDDHRARGYSMVSLPEMRQGRVAVALATANARLRGSKPGRAAATEAGYSARGVAYALAQGQLAHYRFLASQGEVRILTGWRDLQDHMAVWRAWEEAGAAADRSPAVGLILAMEGAEPIAYPEQLWHWAAAGLRVVSLTHSAHGAYAHGAGRDGGLTADGRRLLAEMERCGTILDVTHVSDAGFWEALDLFGGTVVATHHNCRAIIPGARQLADEQIQALVDRDGVIGAACDAWMLYPGWVRDETANEVVSLDDVANHIDHVCQLAGSSRHAAIGTDLDGGFGSFQCPRDLDSIAGLPKLLDVLARRGYRDDDLAAIAHGNWLRIFRRAWTGGRGQAQEVDE